jgi:hypothetical protein
LWGTREKVGEVENAKVKEVMEGENGLLGPFLNLNFISLIDLNK